MIRALVVDDEVEVCAYLTEVLTEEGFDVKYVTEPDRALQFMIQHNFDIILLDYRMPGQSGVEVIQKMRLDESLSLIPVIMVTGLDTEEEKVRALEFGADDYITKPFSPKEMAARIRAVVRRSKSAQEGNGQAETRLEWKDLVVDTKKHQVTQGGEDVYLTLTEFNILKELIKQRGEVLSRDRLRQTALGNLNVTDRTIDVHMASLRKKLSTCADAIQTVRGVGYRFSE